VKVGKVTSALVASILGAALGLLAQQPAPPAAGAPEPKMTMGHDDMNADMMARHREMMARMETMDAKLDALVKEMEAASGSRKVDAVAAVVSELVRQRKEMREHMTAMSPDMMHDCPMMKHKEGGSPSGKPAEHPGHH
jgi:Flp pilus assembly protein TadB